MPLTELKPDQYAVMGHPIAHSKSPRIHTLFAAQTGQNLEYRAILVEPGDFAAAAHAFRAAGGKGLNVTVPFKQDAWVLADLLSARAERAGAVNTLIFESSGIRGDNTDGPGLVRDLTVNHRYPLAEKRILLLGAGGAARGVLHPLLAEQPVQLVIANRTAEKALGLALRFNDLGRVSACGFAELAERRFDLIINATAAGLDDAVPPLPDDVLAAEGWCYDLMYGREPTAFVRWGREHGAVQSLDGLGMLVEQAAEAFHLWRGVWPETGPVITALKKN
ncbi:MAG: shikimate dehydrogenase [Candidatus Competibacteraceae bacterium]|nr:shikimate dehydrogenase [Candidatus Competibacteraceae bacterium]MCB1820072.1 shikimate dehydrogenase [Candidatus Competibacteraceae bacterium]